MSSLEKSCFPIAQLPNELVDSIFDLSSQSELVALCQVSKWIGRMAFPHLYAAPILKTLSSIYGFLRCLRENKSSLLHPSKDDHLLPRSIVHNLWIDAVSQSILPIIELCTNVTNIALHAEGLLWLTTLSNHAVQRRTQNTHITIIKSNHWSFYPYFNMSIPRPITDNPLLCTITHLRITELGGFSRSIVYFPRLANLAVTFREEGQIEGDLRRVVEHEALRVLVIVPVHGIGKSHLVSLEEWVKTVRRDKPGLRVSVVNAGTYGLQGEWEVGGLLCTR